MPGEYWATYNDSCGMMTDTITLTLKPLGIGGLNEGLSMDIYPNPASGTCTILLGSAYNNEKLYASVVDLTGREMSYAGEFNNDGELSFGCRTNCTKLHF
jgi:hypothetical protein